MTRRLSVVPDAQEPDVQCLLCGQTAETYVDLCDDCAAVFSATAERVAASILAARLPAGVTVEVDQVPGQLTLDGQEAACRRAHGPVSELDARGLCAVCAEDEQ